MIARLYHIHPDHVKAKFRACLLNTVDRIDLSAYTEVCEVRVPESLLSDRDRLEWVFHSTQNLEYRPWREVLRGQVAQFLGTSARSTNVGDVILLGDQFHIVASIGFNAVTLQGVENV